MVDINPTISVISLNASDLNAWMKRDCQSGFQKHDPTRCCVKETHFKFKDTCGLKVNGHRKIHHTNTNQKKAGVTVSDRTGIPVRIVIKIKKCIT